MTHVFCAPPAVGNHTPAFASDRDAHAGGDNGAAGAVGTGGGGGGHTQAGSCGQGAAGGEDQASGQRGQSGSWDGERYLVRASYQLIVSPT